MIRALQVVTGHLHNIRGWAMIAVSMILSGCQATDLLYLKQGPGTELSAPDIANATASQNKYFQYLCQQSGLPSACALPIYDQGTWTLIVHQGMNDIDRRCDSYLQWLDDKKRSRGPWLSQINDTSTATTAIMAAISPRSTVPLQIVAQAFNLLSRTIENYNSRLLYEVESSTVNSVVIRARYDFRKNIEGKAFSNRPDAEYALREYMRRCLPFAIETQINDLSTLGSRGIAPSEENTIFQPPVSGAIIGQALLGSIPREGAKAVVTPTKPTTPPASEFLTKSVGLTADEKAMAPGQPNNIQRALCVMPESGIFGPKTREAIRQAKQGLRHSAASIPGLQADKTDTLNSTMIGFFLRQSSCVNHERQYANAFEKYAYPTTDDVSSFQRSLSNCSAHLTTLGSTNAPNVQATGTFDTGTRAAIKWVRHELNARGVPIADGSPLATEELQTKLSACLELQGTN